MILPGWLDLAGQAYTIDVGEAAGVFVPPPLISRGQGKVTCVVDIVGNRRLQPIDRLSRVGFVGPMVRQICVHPG